MLARLPFPAPWRVLLIFDKEGTGLSGAGETAALKYSREHEMEADLRGFGYLCKAGYNPRAMPAMMTTVPAQMTRMRGPSWNTR